jgi:hypothetical protein
MKKEKNNPFGDEAPQPKDFIAVLIAAIVLITLSWILYNVFGLFH